MKYVYDVDRECFKRIDNRGKSLHVNITEANRIVNLLNLNYSVPAIINKVSLVDPQATQTTVKSFIRNYNEGNIEIPTDAPVPSRIFDEMTIEINYNDLEERVKSLEDRMSELRSDCFVSAFAGERKSVRKNWRQRLGL